MGNKSLVAQVRVDVAERSHNCQSNANHRIKGGDIRLKVKNGRGWDHYCRACAEKIIARDIVELTALLAMQPNNGNKYAISGEPAGCLAQIRPTST